MQCAKPIVKTATLVIKTHYDVMLRLQEKCTANARVFRGSQLPGQCAHDTL